MCIIQHERISLKVVGQFQFLLKLDASNGHSTLQEDPQVFLCASMSIFNVSRISHQAEDKSLVIWFFAELPCIKQQCLSQYKHSLSFLSY
jgi:hypothetical protein